MVKMKLFSKKICDWYQLNKRDLPWRNVNDPYKIWLSEIILQQTRVNQGLEYYHKFVEHYPTVEMLAKANEEQILKLWQGLGYYSRARNLHKAAKQVVAEHKGKFPSEYNDLIKLKGVGVNTASAIASFAYNKAYAVVDGNVYRVLSRIFAIDAPIDSLEGKKYFQELASQLLNKSDSSTHNQAMMEFGAMYCIPSNPNCSNCIFQNDCMALLKNKVSDFPVKSKKTKQAIRYFNYLVIHQKNNTFIEKRIEKDIWHNLYQFPLIESDTLLDSKKLIKHKRWKSIFKKDDFDLNKEYTEMKHLLTHQIIYARFWNVKYEEVLTQYLLIKRLEMNNYPLPRLIERFLEA